MERIQSEQYRAGDTARGYISGNAKPEECRAGDVAQKKGLALGDAVAAAARAEAKKVSEGTFDVEVILYDRLGKMVGRAGFDGS